MSLKKLLIPRLTGVLVHSLSPPSRVASRHRAAVNVLTPQGLLISLVESASQMSALGVQLPDLFRRTGEPRRPLSDHIDANADVLRTNNTLSVGEIAIDLLAGHPWDGKAAPPQRGFFDSTMIQRLKEELLRIGKHEGLLAVLDPGPADNPFTRKAVRALPQRREKKCIPVTICLGDLIGLGPGFTPSGDDFTVGVLLGEELLRISDSRAARRMEKAVVDKEKIRRNLGRTTSGGKTILWQALQRSFSSYLLTAAEGLSHAQTDREIRNVLRTAVSHGATSGTDALTGFIWYLDYLLNL